MTGTDVINYDEKWAEMAEKAVQDEPQQGGQFLSIRGGILSFNDTAVAGNQAAVIVLDSVRENTYYTDKYSDDMPAAPRCYAFGRGDEDIGPHPSMQADLTYFEPQSATCAQCSMNVFGSANIGRGKACQNRRRLALLPAGVYSPRPKSRDFDLELFTDPKHYQTAEIAFLKVPVTSVALWTQYVKETGELYHRPPAGILTRLYVEPDAKSQYKVHYEVIDLVPDELAAIIMGRVAEAQKTIITPYSPPTQE